MNALAAMRLQRRRAVDPHVDALEPARPVRLGPAGAPRRCTALSAPRDLEVGHGAVGDVAEVVVDVDEPRHRDEVLAVVEA